MGGRRTNTRGKFEGERVKGSVLGYAAKDRDYVWLSCGVCHKRPRWVLTLVDGTLSKENICQGCSRKRNNREAKRRARDRQEQLQPIRVNYPEPLSEIEAEEENTASKPEPAIRITSENFGLQILEGYHQMRKLNEEMMAKIDDMEIEIQVLQESNDELARVNNTLRLNERHKTGNDFHSKLAEITGFIS